MEISNTFITFVSRLYYLTERSLKILKKEVNMKVSELIRILRDEGWTISRIKGSHRQFKHPNKKGLVTVAGKPSDDVRPGTLQSVLRQAGLR